MRIFLKGIIVGIGGISPGLSGTVLLIIFGLYQKTLDALGSFFKNTRQNARFLLPLIAGMFAGVLLFSNVIDFFMTRFEMPTHFCFLGLILGTLPAVWQEVRKEGFAVKHYLLTGLSALLCFLFFRVNAEVFPQVTTPTFWQASFLGIAVAATAIIPGVDPAVFLSTLGFYRMYIGALADFDLSILLPMLIGLAVGAVAISSGMSFLFKRFYTVVYSVIFGAFLSMIPNILNKNCVLGFNWTSIISLVLMVAGFLVSYYLGKRERNK